jgi:hypothetical protein
MALSESGHFPDVGPPLLARELAEQVDIYKTQSKYKIWSIILAKVDLTSLNQVIHTELGLNQGMCWHMMLFIFLNVQPKHW